MTALVTDTTQNTAFVCLIYIRFKFLKFILKDMPHITVWRNTTQGKFTN